jgi:N utilization substance protein B
MSDLPYNKPPPSLETLPSPDHSSILNESTEGIEENNIEAPQPIALKSRRKARVLSVQCIYSMYFLLEQQRLSTFNEIVLGMLQNLEKQEIVLIDKKYFFDIVEGVEKNREILDKNIEQYLESNWRLDRLSVLVRTILRLGAYELLFYKAVSVATIIDEYIELTKIFNHEADAGFVNSILDNIAKNSL